MYILIRNTSYDLKPTFLYKIFPSIRVIPFNNESYRQKALQKFNSQLNVL